MTFEFELSKNPRDTWDKEILTSDFPEVLQTTMFADLIETRGNEVGYVSIYENGELLGNCLIEILTGKIATWNYGPVIHSANIKFENEIIIQLFGFLKKRGFTAIENIKTNKRFLQQDPFIEDMSLFSRIGESPFIDIRPNNEDILHSFDRSVRKNVNKCLRSGVEILIAEDTSFLEPYMKMLTWFRASRNFTMPPFYPNSTTMKLFNTSTSSMGIALAKYNGDFIAGMGFVAFGNLMTELAMATSSEYEKLKLPINELLKIKAIEFYKNKGIEFYDLAGGEKNPSDAKKQSILNFKRKFASGYASFGIIDRKILAPGWYSTALKRKLFNYFRN